jgi:hypothetical protein
VSQRRNCQWWKEPENEAHTKLFALADYIRESQTWQASMDRLHEQMYAGGRADCWDSSYDGAEYQEAALARNVSRSAIDTYVAKVFKHRPLPEILANKGNWRDQRRAKKMTQFVEGEFDKHKVFKRWARAIGRDSGVWGRGILKIDIDHEESKNIRCERVLPEELFVDAADAKHGAPRNLYYITDVDQGVVIETFAEDDEELAGKIEDAGTHDSNVEIRDSEIRTVDRVRVVESWHLCDNEEAHSTLTPKKHECKGRHVVAVRGVSLVDEVWEFQRFPIANLNYLEPLKGYWGVGLCEQLEGWHREQNLMSEKVSDGHYYTGGGIIVADNTADLHEEDFTNDTNVKFMTKNPSGSLDFFQPSPVHPQDYAYLRDIGPDALNEVGMNTMSATASKPPGVTAAVALQTIDDIQDERLGMQGYGYAQWCCDVAELFLMWIQYIAKKHGDYTASVPLRDGLLPLNWKDVSVDSYIVKAMNGALLHMTPGARRQVLKDLFFEGRIDGATYLRYLDSPDVESEIDTETADRLMVDEQIEAMLDVEDTTDPDAYKSPSPYSTELAWAKRRAQLRVAQATSAGAPEENIDLLRDYILECDYLLQKASGAVTPQPQMAPGAPMQPGGDALGAPPAPVAPALPLAS